MGENRGLIKFLCRRSVGVFSRAFLVFLMKESKKRRWKQPGKFMAKSRSQPVNLPGARPLLMNPLGKNSNSKIDLTPILVFVKKIWKNIVSTRRHGQNSIIIMLHICTCYMYHPFFDMVGACNDIFALLPCKPEKSASDWAALCTKEIGKKKTRKLFWQGLGWQTCH